MEEKQLLTEEEKQNLTVGGYHFRTKEDAVLAKIEQQKIEYIEQRLHYDRPESVLAVYQKAIENRYCNTADSSQYKLQQKDQGTGGTRKKKNSAGETKG